MIKKPRHKKSAPEKRTSTLSDADVELIRELHEHNVSYRNIAIKFEVSKSTVAMICRYARRATPNGWY